VKNVMHFTDFTKSGMPQSGGKNPASVVIIDYELGNVRSVANALQAVGAQVKISRQPEDLRAADGLILPGVGAFGDGMANLQRFGLIPLLNELVLEQKKPFLGICLGMQLLANTSAENGELAGLGWLNADVVRLPADMGNLPLKVPHVGWNDVIVRRTCPVLGLPNAVQSYYFVHSYALQCHEPEIIAGSCEYGIEFPAVVQKNNIFAVQFHPEKSQKHGLNLLANFLTVVKNNADNRYTPQSQPTKNPAGEATC
jgi:glutamine amidotransferase